MGDNVQGGGSDGATLRDRELGSDGGDDELDEGDTPWNGPEDSSDVILESWGGGMIVAIGGGGLVGNRTVANEGVHSEATG